MNLLHQLLPTIFCTNTPSNHIRGSPPPQWPALKIKLIVLISHDHLVRCYTTLYKDETSIMDWLKSICSYLNRWLKRSGQKPYFQGSHQDLHQLCIRLQRVCVCVWVERETLVWRGSSNESQAHSPWNATGSRRALREFDYQKNSIFDFTFLFDCSGFYRIARIQFNHMKIGSAHFGLHLPLRLPQ